MLSKLGEFIRGGGDLPGGVGVEAGPGATEALQQTVHTVHLFHYTFILL